MDCEKARPYMLEALDGILGAEETAEFEAHLSACETCRAELDTLRVGTAALKGSLEELTGGRASPHAPRILHAPTHKTLTLIRQSLLAAAMLAVSVAFLLRLGVWTGQSKDDPQWTPTSTQQVAGQNPQLVPVFITADNTSGRPGNYSIMVPRNVRFTPVQMEELRRNAARIVDYANEKAGRPQPYQKYPLVPVVPVNE